MNNHTWVCFVYRVALRRAADCPECRAAFTSLGSRIPVPPRPDVQGWQQVRGHHRAVQEAREQTRRKGRAHRRGFLERQFLKLSKLPPNPDRAALLRQPVSEFVTLEI